MELPGCLTSNKGVLSVVTSTVSYIRRLLKRLKAHFLKFMLRVCQYFGVALKTFQNMYAVKSTFSDFNEDDIKAMFGYVPGCFGCFKTEYIS